MRHLNGCIVNRYYYQILQKWIKPNKVLVLYGPRQVGKTTLVRSFISNFPGSVFTGTGEDADLQQLMEKPLLQPMKTYFEDYDLVFIDEAQMIPNIGLLSKLWWTIFLVSKLLQQGLLLLIFRIKLVNHWLEGNISFGFFRLPFWNLNQSLVGRS